MLNYTRVANTHRSQQQFWKGQSVVSSVDVPNLEFYFHPNKISGDMDLFASYSHVEVRKGKEWVVGCRITVYAPCMLTQVFPLVVEQW